MFSPYELIIFVSTDCSLVKIISYCLNPNFVLNECADIVLQFIIILTDNFPSIKILLANFCGLSTGSYLYF